jgi:hypothetical protein
MTLDRTFFALRAELRASFSRSLSTIESKLLLFAPTQAGMAGGSQSWRWSIPHTLRYGSFAPSKKQFVGWVLAFGPVPNNSFKSMPLRGVA